MKKSYWAIAITATIAGIVGASAATVTLQHHAAAPELTASPTATSPSSPAASPTDESPEAIASSDDQSEEAEVTPTASPTTAAPSLTVEDRLALTGIDGIDIGMTVEEAEQASGRSLVSIGVDMEPEVCRYLKPEGLEDQLALMITAGTVARIDVWQDSSITTLSGIGIGSTEAQVEAAYPGQIEIQPHPYVENGKYLIYVPTDPANDNYRLVFETDANGIVTECRAGRLPEVLWIEGCA
jgi:hypothetical protein